MDAILTKGFSPNELCTSAVSERKCCTGFEQAQSRTRKSDRDTALDDSSGRGVVNLCLRLARCNLLRTYDVLNNSKCAVLFVSLDLLQDHRRSRCCMLEKTHLVSLSSESKKNVHKT